MTFLTVTGEGPALPFVDFHHASNVASPVPKVGNGGRGRGFEILSGRERRVMVGLDGGRSSKVQLGRVTEGTNVGAVDLDKLPHVDSKGSHERNPIDPVSSARRPRTTSMLPVPSRR